LTNTGDTAIGGAKIGVIFSGQGFDTAQVRHFDERLERYPVLRTQYETVFERPCPSAADCDFSLNENSVLALLLSAFDVDRMNGELRARAVAVSGYSVGFYLALWYVGVLDEASVARLLFGRCQAMNEAVGGSASTMLVILGLPIARVEQMIAEFMIARSDVLCVSNENAPGNVTVGGHRDAVLEFGAFAMQRGAYKIVPLTTSGAWHTPIMEPAASALNVLLSRETFGLANFPLIENITAAQFPQDRSARIELLKNHLWQPVRWTQSVKAMIALGVTEFVELTDFDILTKLGPGISRRVAFRSAGHPG
jgi:[acyl-carrier-protein] S-malonyltransferase